MERVSMLPNLIFPSNLYKCYDVHIRRLSSEPNQRVWGRFCGFPSVPVGLDWSLRPSLPSRYNKCFRQNSTPRANPPGSILCR
eukprot:14273_1